MENYNYIIPGIQNKKLTVSLVSNDMNYKKDVIDYYTNATRNLVLLDGGHTLDAFHYSPDKVDILLLELEDSTELNSLSTVCLSKGIQKVLILTENPSTPLPVQPDIDVQYVYKYSSFPQITQQLILFYFQKKLTDQAGNRESIKKIHKQKRVVFYSTKGGSGKTLVSVNTACHLSMKGQKVLLVDFSQFGSLSVVFQTPKSNNLGEVVGMLEQGIKEEADIQQAVEQAISQVELLPETYVSVLAAASHFKMANLTLSMTDQLLEIIQRLDFDTIICDTSSEISPKNISLLSWATDLFLLTGTDVVVNWQLFTSKDFLQQIQHPFQTQYLLLNKFHPTYSIKESEVEELLSCTVAETIPDLESQLQHYVNRGVLLTSKPNLKIHKHFKRIAHLIHPVFTDKELGIKKSRFKRRGVQV
ncbi:AAA family ATPase [Halalkalibacter alkalisediminis]|uniref:CpaE family protein n=1 Tax=Halalkalibacter alkalisediminis TaxID=935616 RepID=A0ABV6NKE7_9BACI|nr:AAA family ATPase [Halalkalibacter alkalisediminis]